jgi:thiamine transport system permease protein
MRRAERNAALALFLALAAAPLAAALVAAGRQADLSAALNKAIASPATLRALCFGLKQAALSTLVAVAVGLPGAWLTARFAFPGKRAMRALAAVPFCVPPILVVLAFVLFYGNSGFLNRALMSAFGLKDPPLSFLFSFWGLILVHGFYNFPVILQNVGDVWARLPREREDAARSLGASPRRAFLTGSFHSLAPALAQAAAMVFLFCYFSFVVVLVFGPLGGSTLEVEIYRAARFEADPARASMLALIETASALAVVLLFQLADRRTKAVSQKSGSPQPGEKPRGGALAALLCYAIFLLVFFLGPLLSLLVEAFTVRHAMGGASRFGFDNFMRLAGGSSSPLLSSLRASLVTALPAALISATAGSLLALGLRDSAGKKAAEAALSLPLAVSGVVTALGWSFVFPRGNMGLVILVLSVSTLPFSLRSVSASLSTIERNPSLAARTLGANRFKAAVQVELPAIAPAILSSAAFSFSMAAGDANVPLLLGVGNFEPLPLLIYRLVGSYHFSEACAAGIVLAVLTGFVFFVKDKGNA